MTDQEQPNSKEAYDRALTKGLSLLPKMRTPYTPQSPHVHITAFERWGYSEHESDNKAPCDGFLDLQAKLNIDKTHNEKVYHIHDEDSTMNGRHVPATHADFFSIINSPGGMIVAVENRSPSTRNTNTLLPALKFWSDVAYLHWEDIAQDVKSLRYVVRFGISNPHTKSVIEYIMASKSGEERYPGWGKMPWEMDSDEVTALLGTPNGAGVAWLLAQHQKQLGHKIVRRVHLFYNETAVDEKVRKIPSLVFEICDISVYAGEIGLPGQLAGSSQEDGTVGC